MRLKKSFGITAPNYTFLISLVFHITTLRQWFSYIMNNGLNAMESHGKTFGNAKTFFNFTLMKNLYIDYFTRLSRKRLILNLSKI